MATLDELAANAVIEHADAIVSGDLNEFDLFDLVYGRLPVEYDRHSREWCVTAPEDFSTGCRTSFGRHNRAIRTLADLAAKLDLEPWSFAQDFGWEECEIDADKVAESSTEAANALASARDRRAESRRIERDRERAETEEIAITVRDDLAYQATAKGESVEYFDGDALAEAAAELDMPTDSETARLYYEGMIHRAEALRRAEKIIARHEETNYDALLSHGIDRDTARDMIRD